MLEFDRLKLVITPTEFRLISMALSGVLAPRDEAAAKALSTKLLKAKMTSLRTALESTEGALEKSKSDGTQSK